MFNPCILIYIRGQSRASKTVQSQSRLIFWEGGSISVPNYKKKENHPPKLLLKSHRYKVLFGLMTNA